MRHLDETIRELVHDGIEENAQPLGQAGVPVNLTLGFSARQACLAARLANPRYVNVFPGRLNSYVDVLTMPLAVAQAYQKKPAPVPEPKQDADDDPLISVPPGYTTADFNGESLWNLEEPVHSAVANLMAQDVDAMVPDDLTNHFANEQVADFMPTWSLNERDEVLDGGKISRHEVWAERLRAASLGLDALMNMAALGAFVTDQKTLDDRIARYL